MATKLLNPASFDAPKSFCTCGHLGDGPFSLHRDFSYASGHGSCVVPGCDCEKFTWAHFTPTFQGLVSALREEQS